VYVHRIGRTGRYGETGRAITFYESKQRRDVEAIERHANTTIADWAEGAQVTPAPAEEPRPKRHRKPRDAERRAPRPEVAGAKLLIAGGRAQGLEAADVIHAITEVGGVDGWAAYVAGVAWALRDAGHEAPPANLAIISDVPVGAGVSSSAALESAVLTALIDLGGLDVDTPADLIRKAEQVNQTGVAIYWVLIGLTLVIAALFVSNMLARSVAERRLEFATLRAIGLPRRTILFTVGAEAVLISLAAGLIGIALSLVLGALLNAAMAAAYGLEGIYRADAGLFVLVFVLAILLGLASGLLPARQAIRVDPVDVLREA
jgi:hypothetical protein